MASIVDARWAGLIGEILSPVAAPGSSVSAALRLAISMTGADAAQLVEWVQGRASLVARVGGPLKLIVRPQPGAAELDGRPLLTSRVDAYRDVIMSRGRRAATFQAGDREILDAIALLLCHSAEVGRKEATDTLHRVSREIVGSLDLDRVLLTIAQTADRLLSSEMSGVFLAHGSGPDRELRIKSVIGHRTIESVRMRVAAGQGIAGKVLATERPVRVDHYETNDAISSDFLSTAMAEGVQSGLSVPMFAKGALIGVLSVWRRRPSVYSDEDERLLISLADLASIGVVNARMFEEQQRAATMVEDARAELEHRLAAADESLGIHRRLTEIAAAGLDLLGLASEVYAVVGGPVVIDPDGDRPAVRFPPDLEGEEPRERRARPIQDAKIPDLAGKNHQPTDWIRIPIEVAGTRHGVLYSQLPGPPSTRDIFTLEQAATICALLLGHETSLEASAARLRAEFVWDLLEGRQPSADRAAALGLRPVYPARVLLLRASGLNDLTRQENWTAQEHDNNRRWLAARVAATLAELSGHVVPVAMREEQIVAIAPAGIAADAAGLAAKLTARSPFPTITLHLGVSGDAPESQSLPEAFRQATLALSAVGAGPSAGVAFDDLGVLQFLLGPGSSGQLRSYAERVLGPLMSYDRSHGADLVGTLDAYFEYGCNTAQTARQLQLHTKSLAYRLRRIAEIADVDLADRAVRLDFELALRVLRPGPGTMTTALAADGASPES